MPAPGDQHKAWANPFEEARLRITDWTAKDIATISAKLDKRLGPEYISARAGPGGSKVHYLTAEKCITLANEVFGFNGWSSSIQNIQVDFADENPQSQRVSIGLSVIVRVTLRDGTFHEDIGYGSIENAKGKAMAFEKAKKEGTTDGLKRALRSFGSVLGNCIYDQEFVKQVVKVKAQPVKKFDQNNLHRHADYIKKQETKDEPAAAYAAGTVTVAGGPKPDPDPADSFEDFMGELDEADFCVSEGDHPDEIALPGPGHANGAGDKAPTNAQRQIQQHQPQQAARPLQGGNIARPVQAPNQVQTRSAQQFGGQGAGAQRGQSPYQPGQGATAPQNGAGSEPVAFFSAKAMNQVSESGAQGQGATAVLPLPHGQALFNPKAESPSIRKTPGIDHSSSKPLARSGQHVPPAASQSAVETPAPNTGALTSNGSGFTPVRPSINSAAQAGRGSVTNPSLDHARRIGAPSGPGSPLANRGSYKPPTMKRPTPGEDGARPPLADLTNGNASVGAATGTGDGPEAKRPRMA